MKGLQKTMETLVLSQQKFEERSVEAIKDKENNQMQLKFI